DLPDPELGKGDMLVRVKASAICGSEVESYRPPGGIPWGGNPGHEVMGVVEDPNGSRRFHKGDRVGVATIQGCGECFWCLQGKQDFCKKAFVLRNAHSEYVVGKECWMQSVPDDIDDSLAVLLAGDGLGVPYGATIRSGLAAGETTCVFGAGPVGGAMVMIQTFLGARVIAIDINPLALERATKWGAWKTINPKETKDVKGAILDLTNGLGPNKSYDAATGDQELFNLALEVTMPGGTVMTVAHGMHGIDAVRERLSFHVDPAKWEFWGRNLCVRGNWACHFSDYADQLAMVRNGLQIGSLVTATYPLEQFEEAYRRSMGGQEGKVVLTQ
ncbi:MAG: zinc-binding dehydrogenase, partial [Desulfobacteraceae bacterium]|nr:zinc-binding dehydrogenase [Desulfobacteraceae bacterium]